MAGRVASLTEARARLRGGASEAAEEVLAWVVQQPPAACGALAADLRRHALALRERAIPAILTSGEAEPIRVVLELLAAWEKALPLPEALPLLRHADPGIRLRAFRVLHYVSTPGEATGEVLRALAEESPEVQRVACVAAARLRLVAALPRLAGLLHSDDQGLIEAAARALTEMGPAGLEVLRQELAQAWRPEAAAAALEALEEVRTSQNGYGRL